MRLLTATLQRLFQFRLTLIALVIAGGWFPTVSCADMISHSVVRGSLNALTPYSYRLADALMRGIDIKVVNGDMDTIRSEPILPATFVNLTSLEPESVLGRVIAQQVASRFTQRGYRVVEAKLMRRELAMQDGTGELLLSRKARHLNRTVRAALFITGTYVISSKSVFLNAKVIDAQDHHIIVSADAEMAIQGNIKELVRMDRGSRKKVLTDKP